MPPTLCIWLAYLIPSYSMSGLYMQGFDNYNGFYLYLGKKSVTLKINNIIPIESNQFKID